MTHLEMTQHIRKRIKANGIKATVKKYTSCGSNWIRVSAVGYGNCFSQQDQETINRIAIVNGLTGSRGSEIHSTTTFGDEAHFVYPS